jgi:uncharacterized protein (TIGR00369 family)
MQLRPKMTAEEFNAVGDGHLPGLFGLRTVSIAAGELIMQLEIQPQFLAPNGFLHAASVIALADTACGYACAAHLPEGAKNFTTIELKTNFMGTTRSGTLEAAARAAHLGRTTQVWDATVVDLVTKKTLALFRCTQMILWPRQ